MVDPEPLLAFACGYAEDGSGGVFSYQFDPTDGSLRPLTRTKSEAAMYAGLHPSGDYIYTANRISNDVITAYRVDDTGGLKALNRQSSEGTDPSYISVDSAGEYAFVSNYTGGTVAMLPIEGDGRLQPASDIIDHEGSGPNPDRQAQPHPHSANLGPEEDFLYVPDLGTDRIAIYWIDREGGRLRPAAQPHATVQPRAGPRHLDFHPNERFCYVINELDGTIVAFEYDPETGALDRIENVSTLPAKYDGHNQCAEVQVHPTGNWLYGSNRGHDSIAIFEIDQRTGHLDAVDHEPTGGHWPRHFTLDPSGAHLYAENRRSDSVVAFAVDEDTGRLRQTGQRFELPEPVCLQFVVRR